MGAETSQISRPSGAERRYIPTTMVAIASVRWPCVDHAVAVMLETAEAAHLEAQIRSLAALGVGAQLHALPLAGGIAALSTREFGRKLNHVCGAALTAPLDLAALTHLETRYAALGLATEIDLCPYTQPSAFSALGARGYRVDAFSNTYWLALDESNTPSAFPSAIRIRAPRADELDAFVDWSIAGFAAQPSPRSRDLLGALARSARARQDTLLLVAELDAEVAGTAAMSLLPTPAGTVAHLFLASTLPHARSRGVQAALLHARTQLAHERGARFAHITARPGTTSARNVERAGYRVAYTKLTLKL